MHDEPPPRVEYLDGWDAPPPSEPKRTGSARMLVLSVGVLVVALVVAIALGATQRRAVDPVTSTSPTASAPTAPIPSVTATAASRYEVSGDVPTAYQSLEVVVANPEISLEPLPSDLETDPLTLKLLEKAPKMSSDTIAYRLSVCVNSVAVGGGKVRILRDSWQLGTLNGGSSGPARDRVAVEPAFPVEGLYGKGQCATGYVTFSIAPGSGTPFVLMYQDERFMWSWRLG